MPLVRISKKGDGSGDESEALGATASGDLGRLTSNMTLADHVGRFIAGELAGQLKNESLADLLKGKNMIMISGSWG